jgi:general secretion pathway protein G
MRSRRGFTLIELTIVLALVALLLTIAVPRYFHSLDNGKLSVQRQNLAAIRDALDKFYGDQGKYPDELDDLVKKKYLRAIPVDPITELPNWAVLPPEDASQGRVYDIRSAAQQPGETAAAAKQADGTGRADDARTPAPRAADGQGTSAQAPGGTNAR